MKKTVFAAVIATAAMVAQVTPALAIDVTNCTGHGIKILIFNQNDLFETANKGVINLKKGQKITGLNIHGKNYHKFKIFKSGLLDGHLGTIRGIDETAKYSLSKDKSGTVRMNKGKSTC